MTEPQDGSSFARVAPVLFTAIALPGENVLLSPFSVTIALAMIASGAKGETREEILSAIKLHPADFEKILGTAVRLLDDPNALYTLRTANKAYAQLDHPILPGFLETLKNVYNTSFESVDFAGASERVIKQINEWVADYTGDKIVDLLADGSLSELTRLVLVNAIYFKGTWQSQFDRTATHLGQFHVSESESISVEFMKQEQSFSAWELPEYNCQVVELPYLGEGSLSMFIILPNDVEGLGSVESGLATVLDGLRSAQRKQKVVLFLPKFRLKQHTQLVSVLGSLGIKKMFSHNADLSGINGQQDLYVSEAVHQAFIEVNEEGAEAAAATAVSVNTRSLPKGPRTIRCDRPFLFAIIHAQSRAILFLGRLARPTPASGKGVPHSDEL